MKGSYERRQVVCVYLDQEGDEAEEDMVVVCVVDRRHKHPVPLLSVPHEQCVRADVDQLHAEHGPPVLVHDHEGRHHRYRHRRDLVEDLLR